MTRIIINNIIRGDIMSDKFKECYKISEEVFDCYIDFLYSKI